LTYAWAAQVSSWFWLTQLLHSSLLLKSGGSSIILSGGFGVYDFAFENFG